MSLPRRVVFVIGDLRRAGAETQLVRLATGLPRTRYDVRILTLRDRNDFAPELAAAAIPVTSLGRRSAWDVGVLGRLVRELERANPEIVHSFLPFPNLLCALGSRRAGVPTLVLSQRASYEATLSRFWRGVARWAQRRATHAIVNSQAARQEELSAGFPPERITCIPNGVDVAATPAPVERAALGLPEGPLVVCVAQFAAEKAHADLIAAWPSVRRACPDATLALVGDGALREHARHLAERLDPERSVLFLGFRPAAPYLAAADVVTLSSRTEGQPNALLEAMALGKPIVATRVGGIPELVADGETGVLVPSADPAAIAAALGGLLTDAGRRETLGAAARQRAAGLFSTQRMLAATEAVYEALAR